MFEVNFDLLGGMKIDEWFLKQFGETSEKINHHAPVLKNGNIRVNL